MKGKNGVLSERERVPMQFMCVIQRQKDESTMKEVLITEREIFKDLSASKSPNPLKIKIIMIVFCSRATQLV